MQGRYNIDKSFGIFAKFSPPLGRFVLWLARIFLTIMPKGLHGKGIKAKRVFVPAEGGRRVRAYLIGPAKGEGAAPCMVYYHGGGFVFKAERRAVTVSEPSGSAFHRYEEEIKEMAHRRRLPYSFYFEEILMRKYELRRICKTLSYAKRIAARMRNAVQKAALRREIAALEKESIALKRLLVRLAERYALRHEERKKSGIDFTFFGEILLLRSKFDIINKKHNARALYRR